MLNPLHDYEYTHEYEYRSVSIAVHKTKFMIPGLRIRDLQRKFHSLRKRSPCAGGLKGAHGHHAALEGAACKIERDPGSRMSTKHVPALLALKRCSKSTRACCRLPPAARWLLAWLLAWGSNPREAPYEAGALPTKLWGR